MQHSNIELSSDMLLLKSLIQMMIQENLTIKRAEESLYNSKTTNVRLHSIPNQNNVSHAVVTLQQPTTVKALVELFGAHQSPPRQKNGSKLIFTPTISNDSPYEVAIIVDDKTSISTVTIRRDKRL